jgi:hypothetical protein
MFEFLLYRYAELLFLIDYEQSQVFEFDLFAYKLVGTYNYIYPAVLKIFYYGRYLRGFACTRQGKSFRRSENV